MKSLVLFFFAAVFALFALGFSSDAAAGGRDRVIVVNVGDFGIAYGDQRYDHRYHHRQSRWQHDGRRDYRPRYDRSHRDRYDRRYRSNRGWDDGRRSNYGSGYRDDHRNRCYRNCGQQRSHYPRENWRRYYHEPPRYGPPPRHRHRRGCGH